jgi:putative redox protein
MKAERFDFPNGQGHTLTALLQQPSGVVPTNYALFAHCFTCSKESRAARWISDSLAARGIAVLRFDFTGLGSSEGEFANTDFSSNVGDLIAAADHLRITRQAPTLLIGHSLGGAAVLAAAARIPETRAVATIGAPSDPSHVTNLFTNQIAVIRERGEGAVSIGGREFRIRRDFLDDVAEQRLLDRVASMRKALLILHAPTDQVVSIDNATAIFGAARHPKSFIALDEADHLLARRTDARYAGDVIAAWSQRYLPAPQDLPSDEQAPGTVVVSEAGQGKFQQSVTMGEHRLVADEPVDVGGDDSGPSPYDLLLAALGACTSMTLRMYAERKKIPLEHVSVLLQHAKIHATDCANCETTQGQVDRIDRTITLDGDLDETTRARLLEIADKCPVHRTLTSEVDVRTVLADPLSGSTAPPG